MIFKIYHVVGTKFGCAMEHQLKHRTKVQGFTDYVIHEEHTCIFEASKREIELQKEYGYPVDTIPYWKTVENAKKGGWPDSAREAVSRAMKGKPKAHLTKEHQSRAGKSGGKSSQNIIRVCPNCNQKIKGRVYFKSHGDKCKLTMEQAREIRSRYQQGETGLPTKVPIEYNISRSQYYKIIQNRTYQET
jgi:hypothetical protein